MRAEKNWTFNNITNESPVEDLDNYFENKKDTYKVYGALGDEVFFIGMVEGKGTVTHLSATERTVDDGGSVWIQRWVQGKYWLDQYGINKKVIERFSKARS